jgi:hypothetical protein
VLKQCENGEILEGIHWERRLCSCDHIRARRMQKLARVQTAIYVYHLVNTLSTGDLVNLPVLVRKVRLHTRDSCPVRDVDRPPRCRVVPVYLDP